MRPDGFVRFIYVLCLCFDGGGSGGDCGREENPTAKAMGLIDFDARPIRLRSGQAKPGVFFILWFCFYVFFVVLGHFCFYFVSFVEIESVFKVQVLAGLDYYVSGSFWFFFEVVGAERVGGEQAVIAYVPPCWVAWVFRMVENGYSNDLAF